MVKFSNLYSLETYLMNRDVRFSLLLVHALTVELTAPKNDKGYSYCRKRRSEIKNINWHFAQTLF